MATLSSKAHGTMLSAQGMPLPFGPAAAPGSLFFRQVVSAELPAATVGPGRRRLWELSPSLHCSIIGICLTTGELREILGRIARREGLAVGATSDHDLHSVAVRLAERRDGPGKLLHKALDRRHATTLRGFASAKDEAGVEARWQDALGAGAIPGAYWSVLTHPCTSDCLVRRVFGEVHMLSHLVGASNRADIRRLNALEEQNAQLQAELATRRRGWRQALSARDARVQSLERQLETTLLATPEPPPILPPAAPIDSGSDEELAALEARLAKADRRRGAAEDRCREVQALLALAQEQAAADRIEVELLRAEANALQQQLHAFLRSDAREPGALPAPQLGGARVLVVGARPAQIAHWRALAEQNGGELLHHDGGIDDNILALGGLVSRADLILFPVDCVSHEAMWSAKRLASQQGKPYQAMRTASLAAFTHALYQMAERRPADC